MCHAAGEFRPRGKSKPLPKYVTDNVERLEENSTFLAFGQTSEIIAMFSKCHHVAVITAVYLQLI